MIIGVTKEIKPQESRVALTPTGANKLVQAGHKVLVQKSAGKRSGFRDADYKEMGARLRTREQVWKESEVIVKVKEPLPEEFQYLRYGRIVIGFMHLAANAPLLSVSKNMGITAIDYGTIQLADGSTPILAEMSKIAGRIAYHDGAYLLKKHRGILLGPQINVLVLGVGNAGTAVSELTLPTGANLLAMDSNPEKLTEFQKHFSSFLPYQLWCLAYSQERLASILPQIDLLIGAAHSPGKAAQKLVPEWMIKTMKANAVAIDISIDMGGCFETSHKTTLGKPTFLECGVIHYCVTNMPGGVPVTSTPALTHETLPYILELAEKGFEKAARENPALAMGVNVHKGKITHKGLTETTGEEYTPLEQLLN